MHDDRMPDRMPDDAEDDDDDLGEICECECLCTQGFQFPDGLVVITAALLLATLLTSGWGWLHG